jgi:hypothetical protein
MESSMYGHEQDVDQHRICSSCEDGSPQVRRSVVGRTNYAAKQATEHFMPYTRIFLDENEDKLCDEAISSVAQSKLLSDTEVELRKQIMRRGIQEPRQMKPNSFGKLISKICRMQ